MCFSPDSKTLAIDGGKLFVVPEGTLRRTIEVAGPVFFSPDSKTLAARADFSTQGLWDIATGQRIGSVPLPQRSELIYAQESSGRDNVAFSSDGRCLVLDMGDGTAALHELATGEPRRTFGKKQAPPPVALPKVDYLIPDEFKVGFCFAFSPDGRLLVRGGFDRIVHVWDIQTGKELAAFQGHDGAVTAVAFAPNGKRLASASLDSTALIWDVTKVKRPAAPAKVFNPGDLEQHWQTLAETDAAKAWTAMGDLIAAPNATVAFLRGQLKPAAPPDLKRMETKRRLEDLRGKLTGMILQGERLRAHRAVEVLERIGIPEARQVLQALADGAPGALLTTSAQAALRR